MNNEAQEAFIRGYLAALKEKPEPSFIDQQVMGHQAVRSGPDLPASLLADPRLIGDRAVGGVQGGFLQGLIWAILGGITGFGLGATIGAPLQGAAVGGALGSAVGYPIGSARGQLTADKRHLRAKGLEASRPIPIRELVLRPTLSAAAPLTSYTKIRRVSGGMTDQ